MLTTKVGKIGKVMIFGMKNVGKTTILQQLIYGNITNESEIYSTIEDIYFASVDTGRGQRETVCIFDTAGLQGKSQIPRNYLCFPEGLIFVYDPSDPSSLDILADLKLDIDKNKEKKEIPIIVLANIKSRRLSGTNKELNLLKLISTSSLSPIDTTINRAKSWCFRERITHFTVNAMERASLYEPFISLCVRLHSLQNRTSFPQLRQVMQKT